MCDLAKELFFCFVLFFPRTLCRYGRLSELVDHIFPLVGKQQSAALNYPEFSSFCYWKQPAAEISQEDI